MSPQTVDLVFRRVRLDGKGEMLDVAVRDGSICALGVNLGVAAEPGRDIPCNGMLLTPPFVDAHQHLDCAFMLDKVNQSGTLSEAVEIFTELKRRRPVKVVKELAERAITEALFNGTTFIRSYVDVDSIAGLKYLHPILELREAYSGLVDIQIVACMEYSLAQEPEAEQYLRAAMDEGADLVGGIPEVEPTPEDSRRHIQMIFDVAKSYDVGIDMHIDESEDPHTRTLEMLADQTMREGYHGRVAAGHACALAVYDDAYAQRVIEKVAEAGVHVVTNPLTNLYIQGRRDGTPVWRGITRVKELLRAGVNVACGLDDIRNLFLPYGRMNMMEVALFTSLTAHMTTPEEMEETFDMPRYNAAEILGLDDYGVAVGKPADLLLLPVDNPLDALRLQPLPRYVVRGGQIVAENQVQRVRHA